MRRLSVVLTLFASNLLAGEPFAITVLDPTNGWPVPLVELRTTSEQRFVSDNAGRIAIDSPELMNREVWFHVVGHGYELPKDGFGFRGTRLTPTPGGNATIKINRTTIAARVGRLTGSGLFAESQKLGFELREPESGIVGQDSVQTATFQKRRFWLWGDTTLHHYPLGVFHTTGAYSDEALCTDPVPPLKPRYEYFRDDKGRPRAIAPFKGDGPTWLFGLASTKNAQGQEKLVASYTKIRNHLDSYEWGLCAWSEQQKSFEQVKTLWKESPTNKKPPVLPSGHATKWKDPSGKDWLLFGDPFPYLQVPDSYEAWLDPATWKTIDAPKKLNGVEVHSGSIAYHAASNEWLSIFVQRGGKLSFLGEVWFTHSKSPLGPWSDPIQVMSHDKMSFYNPIIHTEFTQRNKSTIYFEGTYTAEFANNDRPSPRHNYNQILYHLDLRAAENADREQRKK
jgi:hypothetical protein